MSETYGVSIDQTDCVQLTITAYDRGEAEEKQEAIAGVLRGKTIWSWRGDYILQGMSYTEEGKS